ncbi:hypothetical protein ACFY2Q_01590 [Micromonospora sp. NPDC000316]|uniref:hypothetical protein n=1 Tax=Micromonospora sp. NPDC000316 TaxID=3364216 RepID=UPI0036CDA6C2
MSSPSGELEVAPEALKVFAVASTDRAARFRELHRPPAAAGTIVSTDLDERAMRFDSYTVAEEFTTAAAGRAQEAAAARVRDWWAR